MILKRVPFAFIFLALTFFIQGALAQRKYAIISPSASPAGTFSRVSDKNFAADPPLTNYATLTKSFDYWVPVWIQLKFPAALTGGTTTFIRVNVSGITSGNYNSIFSFQAFKNANPTSDGTPVATSIQTALVQNGSERYLAITPCADYNSIRVTLNSITEASVYYGFNGFDDGECNLPWAVPAKPTPTQNSLAYCEDSTVTASVSNPICGLIYSWYDGGILVQTGTNSSYTMPPDSSVGIHNLTVAASRPECGVESVKETITVTVNPKPETLNIQSIN